MKVLKRAWGWALLCGILTLVLGILVVAWPSETLKIVAILFGLQLFVMGIFAIALSFVSGWFTGAWSILLGLFSIGVGIIVIRNVAATVLVLSLILGIYWIITGITQVIAAISNRAYPLRGHSILMGILGLIAGIMVVAWPQPTVTVIALVVGIWFILLGIFAVVFAFRLRSDVKRTLPPWA